MKQSLRQVVVIATIGATLVAPIACDRASGPTDPPPPPAAQHDIVFESYASPLDNQPELFRVRGTGNPTRILPAGTYATQPGATADGRWIVYMGAGQELSPDIWISAPDGTSRRRLFSTAEAKLAPSLSPDAAYVTYIELDGAGATSLWLAYADGTNARPLTIAIPEAVLGHGRAAWSPDGARLVFSEGTPGSLDLYLGAPGATSFTRLTRSATSDIEPSWSPDGRRIVFSRVASPARSDLVILDLATMRETAFNLAGSNRQPAWSPDGARIAFSSTLDGGGDHEIYTIAPDGTGIRRVTDNDVNDRHPVWVRDS
ncbi:MAG TPA: hypothetical protein VGT98_17020 [Candidatus Elarobacter sp.]|nr:hypothetical protein [Candidatus Elarobacter sp.]